MNGKDGHQAFHPISSPIEPGLKSPMNKLSTLGPAGTISELAARKYIAAGHDYEIRFFPSIERTFHSIGKSGDAGIIPIENMLEGFIPLTLDLLLASKLQIVGEVFVPVKFGLVGTASSPGDVKKIFVQLWARGQCQRFLSRLSPDVQIVTTDSNTLSFRRVRRRRRGDAAIVPFHLLKREAFPLLIPNVTDYKNNKTRFIVLSPAPGPIDPQKPCRTSIAVVESKDRPGTLYRILKAFARHSLNLSSVYSRPTKRQFGKYRFFLDIEGNLLAHPKLRAAIREISRENSVRILGTYNAG